MAENIAGLLCYAGGWVTGLVFYFIDERPFVRFHAAQSIVVFGLLHLVYIGLSMLFFRGPFGIFGLLWLLQLATLVLWIVLMARAYKGEMFKVPVVADLVDKLVARKDLT
jgi:uncharacterized membrane protein